MHGLGDMLAEVPLLRQAGMEEETAALLAERSDYRLLERADELFGGEGEADTLRIVLYGKLPAHPHLCTSTPLHPHLCTHTAVLSASGELAKCVDADGSAARVARGGAITPTQLSAALSVDDGAPLPAAPWQTPVTVPLGAGACVNLVPALLGVSSGVAVSATAPERALVLQLPRAALGRVLLGAPATPPHSPSARTFQH